MFLIISVALASSFFVGSDKPTTASIAQETQSKQACCDELHSNPVESIDHGKFHFSPLSVGFMKRKGFDISRMISLEEEIMAHPGQQSIQSKDGFYIFATGLKGQERHLGCFKDDDQCRVMDLLELIKK